MNNETDIPPITCPACPEHCRRTCRAEAARRRLTQSRRALSHLKRLRLEGVAMLEAGNLDNVRHALWCLRVERAVRKLFPPPQDYSDAFRLPPSQVQSPLDRLMGKPVEPPAKPIGADRITKQWLIPLVSAMERLELSLEPEPQPSPLDPEP